MIYLFQHTTNQTKLTPKKLNKEINRFQREIVRMGSKFDNQLFIDLSALVWLNTSALVELILTIENLIVDGINVTVALPNQNMLIKEVRHLNQRPSDKFIIENTVRQRVKTRIWLYKLKIIQALSFEHLPKVIKSNIQILDVFDKDLYDKNPSYKECSYFKVHEGPDVHYEYKDYEFYVPLKWTDGSHNQIKEIKDKLQNSILDPGHINSISEIIIKELTKNVKEHSNKSHGLFCVGVTKFNPEKIFKTDYHESEIKFFGHGKEQYNNIQKGEFIIEIVFGDSGDGIIETLKDYSGIQSDCDIIRYAFDKWSTRVPYDDDENTYLKRGTRGLYHVRRIMKNYDGMAAIRTSNYFAGFNDLINEPINEDKLAKFKGTLLTLRLLPKRSKTINYKYYPNLDLVHATGIKYSRIQINIDNLYEKELLKVGEESIKNSNTSFLFSLRFNHWNGVESKEFYNKKLRTLLCDLSNLRHPNVYVVYGFPVEYNDLEIKKLTVDVNKEIQRRLEINPTDSSQEKIHYDFDPVLIISPNGNLHWIGFIDREIENFFNQLLTEELSINLIQVDKNIGKKLIEYVKTDTELFDVQNEKIRLKFNENAPIVFFKNEIENEINEIISQQKSKLIITPNLGLVKGWLNIKRIYDRFENEYALSLYSLWIANREQILKKFFYSSFNQQSEPIESNKSLKIDCATPKSNIKVEAIQKDILKSTLKILVETEVDKVLAEKFLFLLDLNSDELHNNLKVLADEMDEKKPRRTALFEKSDHVIIISSVVSTGETAVSLIKSVLRSNAIPIAFFSLANLSKDGCEEKVNHIEVWGNTVLFFSIISNNKLQFKEKNYDKIIYLKPQNHKEEVLTEYTKHPFISADLRNMILGSKSLHFNHIGKPNGRHFTFYFNGKCFLTKAETRHQIWKNFKPIISDWHRDLVQSELKILNNGSEDYSIDISILEKKVKKTINDRISIWYPDREYSKGYQGQGNDLSLIIKNNIEKEFDITLKNLDATSRENTPLLQFDQLPIINKHMIIVDWGSITGESVEKLIYNAHKDGFRNILVCVFLNQLTEKKWAYLTSISSITTYFEVVENANAIRPGTQLEMLTEEIKLPYERIGKKPWLSNIRVKFIHDFPLTCYESDYECTICALIKDLSDFSIPSTVLDKYTSARKKALNIKPREITDNQEPFHFYHDPTSNEKIKMDQEFILRMFEIKILLMKAQTSTYWRFQATKDLLGILKVIVNSQILTGIDESVETDKSIMFDITEESKEIIKKYEVIYRIKNVEELLPEFNINDLLSRSHALIYFLSLETTWLQKKPLSISDIRQMLSVISRAIIFSNNLRISNVSEDKGKNIGVVRIKYAAITILRMVDKPKFVKSISTILKETQIRDVGSESIIENVLFHTNTFLSKDYHASHEDLDDLLKELEKVEQLFEGGHEKYPLIREAVGFLNITANNLIIKGEVRKLRKGAIVENCKKIIDEGIEKIRYDHPQLIQSFNDLEIVYNEEFINTDLTYFLSSYNKNWIYVSGFIKNIFGLHFSEIKTVLDSEWATVKGANMLRDKLFNKYMGVNDPFSLLIKQINDSKGHCLSQEDFVKSYNEEYENIRDLFVSHPRFNKRKSIILEILDGLRGNLNKSIKYAETKYGSDIKFNYSTFEHALFYPQDLLDALIDHVCKNALEKKIGDHFPEIFFKELTEKNTIEYFFVNIINRHTDKNKKGKGTGLLKHQENIPRFFGEMKYDANSSENFVIYLKFLKYE